jgi:MYXO-CTERM domain-containing protein
VALLAMAAHADGHRRRERWKTMRLVFLFGLLVGAASLSIVTAEDARACGGCFHEPTSQNATVVTDHRMAFSVSPAQTTLYDQIEYSGSPASFAWVLPVHGQVTVGLSSDLVFQALDQATQTTILAPPPPQCPSCNCNVADGGAALFSGTSPQRGAQDHGVTVTVHQVVGPYETVQLHPTSTSDTGALTSFLDANSYGVPPNVDPVIAAYVSEGFDFLALRLAPGQGVQDMRPISVTTPGAGLTLPLRMVAAGTGATVGITLWVIAAGRYEPQNFGQFVISAADLVWDWSAQTSNYTTLRSQKETALHNTVWQVESSLDLAPYTIENVVLQDPAAAAYEMAPAIDGGPNPSSVDAGGLLPIEARAQDLQTLFPTQGAPVRITRLRADLSQAALGQDLVLQASADQSVLSNNYQAEKSVNDKAVCPSCPCRASGCATSHPAASRGGSMETLAALLGLGIVLLRARRRALRQALR